LTLQRWYLLHSQTELRSLEQQGDKMDLGQRGRLNHPGPSMVTMFVASFGMGLAALLTTIAAVHVGGVRLADGAAMYGAVVVDALAAAVVFHAATRLTEERHRTAWLLVGASVALAAAGDLIFAYNISVVGIPPTVVSISDVFFVSGQIVFAVAMIRLVWSYRERVELSWTFLESAVTSAIVAATAWAFVLAPSLQHPTSSHTEALGNAAYVALDMVLLFAPALALLLVAVRLDDVSTTTSLIVLAGVSLTTLADLVWFSERAHATWRPGSFAGFGFMAGNILLAVAATSAVQAQERLERQGRLV
jgi:hypothetical protein